MAVDRGYSERLVLEEEGRGGKFPDRQVVGQEKPVRRYWSLRR
jgi:hypothetical protein